jgi:hypothetical protein
LLVFRRLHDKRLKGSEVVVQAAHGRCNRSRVTQLG